MAAVLSILPKRKGRQAPEDGRRLLTLFPRRHGGRAFVYAIAFDGGVIKVGQSAQPRERLLTHWKSANGEVLWVHLFESMHRETAHRVERRLPLALAGFARQINGSEWYFATDKRELIQVVRATIRDVKDEVTARWVERERDAERIREVTRFMVANGLLAEQTRP